LNFLDRFSKNPQIENFGKIRPVGEELSDADRQMDRRTWETRPSFFTILQTHLKAYRRSKWHKKCTWWHEIFTNYMVLA